MAYIGHYTPLQIFPENVRDDIVPSPPQTTFLLSQAVPGGYESNVLVVKRTFSIERIIENTDQISFVAGTNEIVCNDPETAQLLSRIQVGEAIKIENATNLDNNGIFVVSSVVFDVSSITFTVLSTLINETGTTVNAHRADDGPWEILEPEVDYTIAGIGANYNREITFSVAPEEEDQCYVVHRGSATYNLVPSNNSVGPDQLSHNLRTFTVDRFEGDGIETDFVLSQEPINGRSVVVTVDGEVLDGDDPMAPPFPFLGEWELDPEDTISFHVAPALGSKIRVLHLGFSTVSRRAALSDGQLGVVAPNSITQLELANNSVTNPKIANDAVSTAKIQNNAVTGVKILLANEESLRGTKTDTSATGLIRLNNGNETIVQNDTLASIEIGGTKRVNFTSTTIEPETTNTIDLGTSSKKFKNLELAGNAQIDGNLNVTGVINGLQAVPTGSILLTARSSAPTGYLLCRGQAISRSTYSALFSAIGTTYGPGDGSTTFNIPDLQQRFPLGQTLAGGETATNLGTIGGSINHTHDFSHIHDLSASGSLPNHTHAVGTLSGNFNHIHNIAHFHNAWHNHVIPPHTHGMNLITPYNPSTGVPYDGRHIHSLNTGKTAARGEGAHPVRAAGPTYATHAEGFAIFPALNDSSVSPEWRGAHQHQIVRSSYDPTCYIGAFGKTFLDTKKVDGYSNTGNSVLREGMSTSHIT